MELVIFNKQQSEHKNTTISQCGENNKNWHFVEEGLIVLKIN